MTIPEAIQFAVQRHQAGNIGEAVHVYQQILAVQPDQPDALHLLGVANHQGGQSAAGAELIRRAIGINPLVPDYHINLGVILVDLRRLDEALGCQRRAIELSPDNSNAYNNLGFTLQEMDNIDDAITAGLQSVAIDPKQVSAHNNLGTAYLANDELDRAEACFRYAAGLNPNFPDAHNNLGKVLYAKGKIDESIASLLRAIALRPNYPEAHNNLGNALCDKEQWEKAIASVRHSLLLRPDYPAGHWNLSLMLLRQGDFERGWAENDWRFRVRGLNQKLTIPQPWWDGDDLDGRRILIHSEQGLGDTIQFVRYLPEVAARGGEIILAAQAELLTLLKDFPGVWELKGLTEVMPEFEVHCPLLSLPRLLNTTAKSIPAQVPYLSADAGRAERWRERLAGDGKKVGLVWAGKREHTNDRNRTFGVETYAPLAEVGGVRLVSLQKGIEIPAAPFQMADWTGELNDFADTAGLVANLDLVITVDTSVAHLAGAMGKPVWVLLPLTADWRWMLKRTDSPWYPTMRLFRQRTAGDWAGVIGEVRGALAEFVAG